MDYKKWLPALLVLCSTSALAEETAQRHEPLVEDKTTAKFFNRLQLTKTDVGVYYVPPPDVEKRGYIFDDIPRETGITQANLTEQRMAKEGKFVKFNHRQIVYSLMETKDDSLRFNVYPSKGAVMLSWTHSIPVLAD